MSSVFAQSLMRQVNWQLSKLLRQQSGNSGRGAPQWSALRCLSSQASADISPGRRATVSTVVAPPAAVGSVASRDEKRAFIACFTDIVRSLTEVGMHKELEEANKWYAKVLQNNVPGGKLNRGLAVPFTYQLLRTPATPSHDELQRAYVVGWCVEMLQAFFLVIDDIMDGSETRRGRPAWHCRAGVGLSAINDAVLLQASIYKLLRLHCSDQPYYTRLLELFHKTTLKTSLGQSLDMLSSQSVSDIKHGHDDAADDDIDHHLSLHQHHHQQNSRADLSKYTMDRYKAIVKYKTAHYSFHLPVGLALYMAGVDDVESHRQTRSILLEMGHLFQVQDDFLDCFGDAAVTGKHGTDIQDGKCSWMIVVALQRASHAQKLVLKENYGVDDEACVRRVKEIFSAVNLAGVYHKYEVNTYEMICRLIEQTSRGIPHKVFYKLLEKIYQRDK